MHVTVSSPVMCAGPRGFAAGMLARILTISPGNAIAWLVYEHAKDWLRDR